MIAKPGLDADTCSPSKKLNPVLLATLTLDVTLAAYPTVSFVGTESPVILSRVTTESKA